MNAISNQQKAWGKKGKESMVASNVILIPIIAQPYMREVS